MDIRGSYSVEAAGSGSDPALHVSVKVKNYSDKEFIARVDVHIMKNEVNVEARSKRVTVGPKSEADVSFMVMNKEFEELWFDVVIPSSEGVPGRVHLPQAIVSP